VDGFIAIRDQFSTPEEMDDSPVRPVQAYPGSCAAGRADN
jgi:hypothetical protein